MFIHRTKSINLYDEHQLIYPLCQCRVWELLDDMVKRGLKPGVVSYRACVKAAAIDGDVDRALAMLLVIRDQTRIGFDFRSWQAVAYLCSLCDRKEDEFLLRREIEERNNFMSSKTQSEGAMA